MEEKKEEVKDELLELIELLDESPKVEVRLIASQYLVKTKKKKVP